jgi:release factor glutamine methyltransferase
VSRESWKLIDLLNTASNYLSEKEIEHPRRNAEALLGKTLSMPRIDLYLQHDRPLDSEQVGIFRELIRRRIQREPLQQILGEVEFLGCKLRTPRGLLVPRPETELLADLVARKANKHFDASNPPRVLDLGCGTGCIAIALASMLTSAAVDAVDIDPLAVSTTRENTAANQVEQRVRVIQADMLKADFTARLAPPYDIVVSNPPYIREAEFDQLATEIRHFENPLALIGGDDGLKFYRRIAEMLPAILGEGGFAALEIGADQAAEVIHLFSKVSLSASVSKDLNGIDRVLFISKAAGVPVR